MANEPHLPDIAQSLANMAETTTAAELVRRKGQTKQVKVLSERRLMEWIGTLLHQQMAGREDQFTDAEKAALLAQTQEELKNRIARQRELEQEQIQASCYVPDLEDER